MEALALAASLIGMILGIAFLLMVSLVLDTVLQSLSKMWGTEGWQVLAQGINFVVGFALTTTVFALIYKLMPRAKIEWHDVWVGAAVTAVLFTVGKFLISLYIGRSAVASSFGAAGSLAVVMIWVYYSAQIFLLGAEFTWVYSHEHGSRKARRARARWRTRRRRSKNQSRRGAHRAEAHARGARHQGRPARAQAQARRNVRHCGGRGRDRRTRLPRKPDFLFHRSRPATFSRMRWR